MPPLVTAKHVFPSVGLFEVRRVGGIVGIHIGTPTGEYIFHVRERSFVKHARGARDAQGNPFRTLDEIDAERNVLESDATVAQAASDPNKPRDTRRLDPETEKRYVDAFVERNTTPGMRWRDAAQKHGVTVGSLISWCYHHLDVCRAAMAAARSPVLKPGGKLL